MARVGIVLMVLAGCESAPLVPPGVTDVTGAWDGTWNGAAIGRGRIILDLKQEGTNVTGKVRIFGAPAISATDGAISGVISGTTFAFSQPAGFLEGEMTVADDTMVGQATGRLKMGLSVRRLPKQP
jgi:hypothetical protein